MKSIASIGRSRQKGLALVTVVTLLALATVLMMALFSTTQTEMAATASFANGAAARQQSELAVNVVLGQLQKATRQDDAVAGREIWTSQPGMARQYTEKGWLNRAYKLYSSRSMVITGGDSESADAAAAEKIIADVPVANWNEKPAHWVDMNEPVWRSRAGSDSTLVFPIVDPRAYVSGNAQRSVEGFSYAENVHGVYGTGSKLNGVVLPASGGEASDSQRVPMPVEWIYVLEDGTMGYLDDAGLFVGPDNIKPTTANPIVSRLAFWTDDETSKVNLNTAGDGTPWSTPWLYHQRDGDWARFQPMMYEYQRYPGHPATVAVSSVLFPGVAMNPPRTSGSSDSPTAEFTKSLEYKEILYDLLPKLLPGGSKAGSVSVPVGRVFTPTDFKNVQDAIKERLFATVDEFLLEPNLSSGKRKEISFGANGPWANLPMPDVLERLRFFFTTNSRAPETNLFGLPKIAMWPLHDSQTQSEKEEYRTVFDHAIANASTIAGNEYYFRRKAANKDDELGIFRNAELFKMLRAMTNAPIPGFGASNFFTKYGKNREQILVEIFDYIRSTNLYDDVIAERSLAAIGQNPNTAAITGAPNGRSNAYSASGGLKTKTFTPMRRAKNDGDVGAISMGSWPGHGQVVPTNYTVSGTKHRGMGRFPTISEVGFLFICSAEGTNKAGGRGVLKKSAPAGDFPSVDPASGYTPANYRTAPWDQTREWYSNFPPLTGENRKPENGFYLTRYGADSNLYGAAGFEVAGNHPDHPGYNPYYWNWSLENDTPLPANTKRIQSSIILEWFIPAAGWTLINPDFEIEIDASKISVDGKYIFAGRGNAGKVVLKARDHMNSPYEIYQRGGTTSYRGFLMSRKMPRVGNLPEDNGYSNTEFGGTVVENAMRYDLVSDFFDVPSNGPILFQGGELTITFRMLGQPKALQVIKMNALEAQLPAPDLIEETTKPGAIKRTDGSGIWDITHQVPPPYWWSMHADGVIGRTVNGGFNASDPAVSELGGRVRYPGSTTNYGALPPRGNLVFDYNGRGDVMHSLVLKYGDPRLIMGMGEVPASEWVPHPNFGRTGQRMAHRIVLANQGAGPGIDNGSDVGNTKRFVEGSKYPDRWLPDITFGSASKAWTAIRKYGDFDSGIANMEDGAYINKPDEGNTLNTYTGTDKTVESVPYFSHTWISWSGGSSYFSPNRQVSSPGMFGSLPTGVYEDGLAGQEGWRTLLFRPQDVLANDAATGRAPHPGASSKLRWTVSGKLRNEDNGGIDPPDHLLMDFFWMPVVEPYAISEPGSTAGKINMNYQMAPFRHIRRATALHAAMKNELIHALPKADSETFMSRPTSAPAGASERWFWKYTDRKYWHRDIDVTATMAVFDDRLSGGYNFISPTQICEMPLLPKRFNTADTDVPTTWGDKLADHKTLTNTRSIRRFWSNHLPSSDNMKERPYANLYPKLTTRSNTFRVHVRAQTLKKSRSSNPQGFQHGVDSVVGEYRGSILIERYLDEKVLKDSSFAGDYTSGALASLLNLSTRPPLDAFHSYRILSKQRFD